MNKMIVKSALIGGLIVFVWSFFSWMVIPWHQMCFNKFKDEKEVLDVIKDNAPISGVYILPNMYSQDSHQRAKEEKLMKHGPVMFASICLQGAHKMTARPLIISLITQIIGAAIIAWMLAQSKFREYKKQVYFVTVVGFLVGLLGLLPAWTWMSSSAGYTLVLWLDLIIGWFLAGLAIAKLNRR